MFGRHDIQGVHAHQLFSRIARKRCEGLVDERDHLVLDYCQPIVRLLNQRGALYLRFPRHLLCPPALGDIVEIDDNSLYSRIVEQAPAGGLEEPPRAIIMLKAHLHADCCAQVLYELGEGVRHCGRVIGMNALEHTFADPVSGFASQRALPKRALVADGPVTVDDHYAIPGVLGESPEELGLLLLGIIETLRARGYAPSRRRRLALGGVAFLSGHSSRHPMYMIPIMLTRTLTQFTQPVQWPFLVMAHGKIVRPS